MNQQSIFSIVTATYNVERWLGRTILSILSQSYPNIEYILIGGTSKDETVEVVEQCKSGIASWISEPDKGLYDVMSKGLKRVTGDYVWFLNARDILYTADTMQKVVASLKKKVSLPDVTYGETQVVGVEGRPLGMRRLKASEKLARGSSRIGVLVYHRSFISKREIVSSYNVEYYLTADYDQCTQCLRRSKRVHNTRLIPPNPLEEGLSSVSREAPLRE